ncbi:LytR C-terminal domain-containing protein [Streptomyces syringium]|uniref:LytR C-terminal domain-containing protein n=1 Tax=Streptomyces syringium TaxID=76729 RepID=UPI003AAD3E3E
MSMLTPPGMGGKYRITGSRFPHMRRPRSRRRIVLAAVAATVALGLGGWGTVQLVDVFSGGGSTETRAAPKGGEGDCKPADGGTAGRAATAPAAPKPLPKPSDITVNVYNATPRGGLAKTTADELAKRGFKIGKVGNAPAAYDKKVAKAGLLLGGPESDAALKLVGAQLTDTEAKAGRHDDADIDLILGTAFKQLSSPADAERAVAELTAPPKPSPSARKC